MNIAVSRTLLLASIMAISIALLPQANANLIQNGNFESCDFTDWSKDTDGFGDVSTGTDFRIDRSVNDCRAVLNVDEFDIAGDPLSTPASEAFFANTLFQELDFSGNADAEFELSFSLESSSQILSDDPSFIADEFLVLLNDGNGNSYNAQGDLGGFLVNPMPIDGLFQNTYTFLLDSFFTNTSGWFLDFQLAIGWDGSTGLSDGFASSLFVSNVSLLDVSKDVVDASAPSVFILVSFVMALTAVARPSRLNGYRGSKL
ncbi:hypothetical protein ACFO4O_01000 [Glaciecola siphonariae]|uniref:PEP-CTERM sorting domain-containing protein n=1 Tax=Glaciecola siphonariae TaxID=521012 RepID=A0ABV9LQF4_9ALTE